MMGAMPALSLSDLSQSYSRRRHPTGPSGDNAATCSGPNRRPSAGCPCRQKNRARRLPQKPATSGADLRYELKRQIVRNVLLNFGCATHKLFANAICAVSVPAVAQQGSAPNPPLSPFMTMQTAGRASWPPLCRERVVGLCPRPGCGTSGWIVTPTSCLTEAIPVAEGGFVFLPIDQSP